MRLLGRRDYRITGIRGGDSDRAGSAGLIVIVAARPVEIGPFREAGRTAVCQGDTHLKISFAEIVPQYMGSFWNFTTESDIYVGSY